MSILISCRVHNAPLYVLLRKKLSDSFLFKMHTFISPVKFQMQDLLSASAMRLQSFLLKHSCVDLDSDDSFSLM